eukprot:scaffold409072_cov14-Prasinocladus_malaysianus.AAC.1
MSGIVPVALLVITELHKSLGIVGGIVSIALLVTTEFFYSLGIVSGTVFVALNILPGACPVATVAAFGV